MIKGELLGGRELQEHVKQANAKLLPSLSGAIGRLVLMLLRNVKADKLSGQVLKVRTGRLRRSINSRLVDANTDHPAGYVGTNLSYARPHEYGFTGTVSVRQSLRMVTKAFGKSITPVQATVSAHTRKVNLPERSFLRTGLADLQPTIKQEIRNAVTEAVK